MITGPTAATDRDANPSRVLTVSAYPGMCFTLVRNEAFQALYSPFDSLACRLGCSQAHHGLEEQRAPNRVGLGGTFRRQAACSRRVPTAKTLHTWFWPSRS